MIKKTDNKKRGSWPGYTIQGVLVFGVVTFVILWFFWPNQVNQYKPVSYTENFPFVKKQKMHAISDFGKLSKSVEGYYEVEPESVSEAHKVLQLAYDSNTVLRIRGSGHSPAGMSLPSDNELLISTRGLTHFRLEEPGTVTIGAGVSMWEARDFVEGLGYQLPVFPDGQGPTLGGYIAVGGIGVGSFEFGGFWENVKNLTLITGRGELKTITQKDELFPWVFGANGQLGLVVEAKLNVIGSENNSGYEIGTAGDVFDHVKRHRPKNDSLEPKGKQLFFFQYLFASKSQYKQALQDIEALMKKYTEGFHYLPVDQLIIKHKSIMAPLVYQYPETEENPDQVVALGIRAQAVLSSEKDKQRLIHYGEDFREMALTKGYKIYLQHDARFHHTEYPDYYGSDVYEKFLEYKKQLDPENILNPGSVFSQ